MGLFEKLNYGGVPFGARLIAASQALRSIQDPNVNRTGLALVAQYQQRAQEEKKAAAELAKKQEMANRLADKLELSNPELAAALRADPTLVDDYAKGQMSDSFQSKRDERQRGWQIEDRNWNAQREDARTASDRAFQSGMQEDRQAHDIYVEDRKRQHEQALREGRMEDARLIAEDFFMTTGKPIETTTPGATAPGVPPSPVPTPGASSVPQPTESPELSVWQAKFNDPKLTSTESALLTAAFKSALTSGPIPDRNAAVQAAAETYQKILGQRARQTEVDAAASEAKIKAEAAAREERIGTATTAEKAIKTAETRANAGDSVLDAINDIETAVAEENEGVLPAIGTGSWAASFLSETNARAVYKALDTIKANIGFDRLQQMREESPTGGALGQVAIQELDMLQSTIASLDQTDANFLDNVQQVKELYAKIQQRNKDYAEDIQNLRKHANDPAIIEAFQEMYGVDSHLKYINP